jgi:sigma-B regulation protein RsbU (phosphoserine phosphatase)
MTIDENGGISQATSEVRPSSEAVLAELERILASPDFARSGRMKDFIRFLVEATLNGEAGRTKEFSIAVEVFGRDETFDPQTSSLVRVEAGRLRRTLKQYYLTHGKDDPLRIEIPKGKYAAEFRLVGGAGSERAGPAARTATGEAPARTPMGHGGDGQARRQAAPAATRKKAANSTRPPTILVVDDEPQIEALISQKYRRRVRDGSLSFLFAHDGEEALDTLLATSDIDLILTDINMPRMDGLALLDHLPEIDPILMAVVVTAYGDMPNIRTAMNRGAFDFITKPIDFDDLTATIERSLAQTAILREAAVEHDQLLSLRKELTIARGIQNSLLPDQFPKERRFAVHGRSKPAAAFGSDFYDVFRIDDNRWGILIGEASGRGIRAALGMAVSRTAIRTAALTALSARDSVERLNDLLCDHSGSEILASLFFGFYDAATGALAFVNAGHQLPYALRAGGRPEALPGEPDLAVGLQAEAAYAEHETSLAPGESLFLYTDGVPRAFDAGHRQFSIERRSEERRVGKECRSRWSPYH